MTDLIYLSYKPDVPASDYWDLGMLKAMFSHEIWSPVGSAGFQMRDKMADIKEGAVIVFPARRQIDCVDELNADLARLQWAVVILTGDEAREFPAYAIHHPNMKLWIMSANPKRHVDGARKIGSGFPPQARHWLPQFHNLAIEKPLDYYFAGQITHARRKGCAVQLETMREHEVNNHLKGEFHFSEGFTQGVAHEEYYRGLASAKTAPCPSGPENPDSFRLYEALEAGAVPIVDAFSPQLQLPDYWTWFFDEEPPFPVYNEYDQLRGYTSDAAARDPALANKVFAWWMNYKRRFCYWLQEDIAALNPHRAEAIPTNLLDAITVLMPTSPIAAHPSTEMIEKTIADIRVHLPDSEIIIGIDGIRPEQEHYRARYEQYTRRLLWLCNNKWHNVLPVLFEGHNHQARMARECLKLVKTPCIVYAEHDTPLTPDRPIEWHKLVQCILDGTANVIRFSHESLILEEHKHLILSYDERHHGAVLTKTQQWSQRPHLASTAFYRHMIDTYFHPASLTMIEDVIHQKVEIDMRANGQQAWYNWRIWLYTPHNDPDGSILRSYNLDGRGTDEKYPMQIVDEGA
jgi:hypothetical protein